MLTNFVQMAPQHGPPKDDAQLVDRLYTAFDPCHRLVHGQHTN